MIIKQSKAEILAKVENGTGSDANDEWDINWEAFEKSLNSKTKCLVINSPHNPLGKIFTKIINKRMEVFANENSIISENQAGFRKNHSTIDQVFVLQNLIEIVLSEKRKLFVAWVDFSKAFPSVWRNGLWFKLINSGVSSKMINLIKSIYSCVKVRCSVMAIHLKVSTVMRA